MRCRLLAILASKSSFRVDGRLFHRLGAFGKAATCSQPAEVSCFSAVFAKFLVAYPMPQLHHGQGFERAKTPAFCYTFCHFIFMKTAATCPPALRALHDVVTCTFHLFHKSLFSSYVNFAPAWRFCDRCRVSPMDAMCQLGFVALDTWRQYCTDLLMLSQATRGAPIL